MSNISETCRDMLIQRGYDIIEDDDEKIIGKRGNDNIYVMLNIINKFNVDEVQACISFMKEMKIKHAIIIYRDSVTAIAKKIVHELKDMKIEIFEISEVAINITKYCYVPTHKKLENGLEFKKKYGIKHAIMFSTEAIAKFYAFEKGDVIEIERKDGTIAYRIVK